MISVDMFVEDAAQEAFLGALTSRLVKEEGGEPRLRARAARGGAARALAELRLYQEAIDRGQPGLERPDILVVGRDTDCQGYVATRDAVMRVVSPAVFALSAIACPDPAIERWYMADPETFQMVVGADPRAGQRHCDADLYKARVADAIERAGAPSTLGGIELANDLALEMDLYRAGRREPTLRHFVDEFRGAIRRL
jgi:hypothetical protein